MISNQDMPKKLPKEDWELMPMLYIGHQKIGQKDPNGDQKKIRKKYFLLKVISNLFRLLLRLFIYYNHENAKRRLRIDA